MTEPARWESEQEFFDEEYVDDPVADSTIRRYAEKRRPWLAGEFPFCLFGDLRGKYVLELGCGTGNNAIVMALQGAEVVGVDISPRAIEIARRHAEDRGVSSRATFIAAPMELFRCPDGRKFDIVCGFAVLHHLIPVLDQTLAALRQTARPGALFLFSEPISLWRWLRRLRLMLPIAVHGTPEERPLEPAELATLRKHIPFMQVRYYNALIRAANRFLLRQRRYEDLPSLPRLGYDALARIDDVVLNRLGVAGLASIADMSGHI